MQESEYGSTVVIYIPTKKYKYIVITERDSILKEYYITRRSKSMSYKVQNIGTAHELQKGISRASQEEAGRGDVTPQSRRYGGVMATYIRRAEIPSRTYAKPQYKK